MLEDSEKKGKMLAADCLKKSESSSPSPDDPRRCSGSPEDNARRSVSPVEMIDGATNSPPRTPTPEPTASPLELLEAPMAREDEEEEEEEIVEDGSSSPSSPEARFAKEFAQSSSQRKEEQSSTDDIDLASSVAPNLNLTQNHNLNENLNQNI